MAMKKPEKPPEKRACGTCGALTVEATCVCGEQVIK